MTRYDNRQISDKYTYWGCVGEGGILSLVKSYYYVPGTNLKF